MSQDLGQLCSNCIRIFQGSRSWPDDSSQTLWENDGYASLLQPRSCCVCAILWTSRERSHRGKAAVEGSRDFSEIRYVWFDARIHMDAAGYSLTIEGQYAGEDFIHTLATMCVVPAQDTNNQSWTSQLSDCTVSNASISFLKTKLGICRKEHVSCNRNCQSSHPWYPSRLLEIEEPLGSKVYLKDDLTKTAEPYISLSHCWGGMQPIQLTARTEASLKSGINVDVLPKTFREAILVCKRLGVKRLWIDSLCIFQDDLGDWTSEAFSMSDVYSNAVCNIAATDAPNGSVGLNFDRCPLAIQPFWVEAKWQKESLQQPHIDQRYLVYPPSSWMGELTDSALNRRAWVAQERILSKRVMHFTSSQVFWECLENQSSEVFADSLPGWTHSLSPNSQILKKDICQDTKAQTKEQQFDIYTGWQWFLFTYSQCQLSVKSDKLVAISGIAKKISDLTGDKLIYGLWESYFLEDLLWTVCDRPSGGTFPREWRAPTWSWACTDCHVAPSTMFIPEVGSRRSKVTIEKLDVDAIGQNSLKHASLTLRGKLLRTTCYVGSIYSDDGVLYCEDMSSSILSEINLSQEGIVLRLDTHRSKYPERVDMAFVAILESDCDSAESERWYLEGLALQRRPSGDKHFERIGYVLVRGSAAREFYEAYETKVEQSMVIY